ncbi:MAG TPA: hypothetical protein VN873_17245 [Candidatus Angelobacter sp.]|nr:hypothetical protein [Candidatus Angelobacter sp.]
MKGWILTLLVAAVSLGFTAEFAQGQPGRNDLDLRAHRINSMAFRSGSRGRALRIVSDETGIPMRRLQDMDARNPAAGPAGLMIASVLANNTRNAPEQFVNRHANGRSWTTMAVNNNVPINRVNARLDRLERSLNTLTPTGRPRPIGPPRWR